MKDILLLEQVQRRATKFILNNYTMDYKTRLFHLKLLPLMYVLELHDVLFLIKSLNSPTSSFNISDHVCFNNSCTRSSSSKLCHRNSDNVITANSYFYRIPRLWNALPIIDLSLSLPTIKHKLIIFYGIILQIVLTLPVIVLCIFYVLVGTVVSFPTHVTLTFCSCTVRK